MGKLVRVYDVELMNSMRDVNCHCFYGVERVVVMITRNTELY